MGTDTFSKMPTSTIAVETYRVSKSGSTEPLSVAMLGTYKYDMAATLEHVARQKEISTSDEDMSIDAQRQHVQKQTLAQQKEVEMMMQKALSTNIMTLTVRSHKILNSKAFYFR